MLDGYKAAVRSNGFVRGDAVRAGLSSLGRLTIDAMEQPLFVSEVTRSAENIGGWYRSSASFKSATELPERNPKFRTETEIAHMTALMSAVIATTNSLNFPAFGRDRYYASYQGGMGTRTTEMQVDEDIHYLSAMRDYFLGINDEQRPVELLKDVPAFYLSTGFNFL